MAWGLWVDGDSDGSVGSSEMKLRFLGDFLFFGLFEGSMCTGATGPFGLQRTSALECDWCVWFILHFFSIQWCWNLTQLSETMWDMWWGNASEWSLVSISGLSNPVGVPKTECRCWCPDISNHFEVQSIYLDGFGMMIIVGNTWKPYDILWYFSMFSCKTAIFLHIFGCC